MDMNCIEIMQIWCEMESTSIYINVIPDNDLSSNMAYAEWNTGG